MTDLMPVDLDRVTFDFTIGQRVFFQLSMSLPQGYLVAIAGPPNCGKASLIHLLGMRKYPTLGEVFIPTHLRVLHVSAEPCLLKTSPFQNLNFGLGGLMDIDIARLHQILNMAGGVHLMGLVSAECRSHPRQPLGYDPPWQPQILSKEFQIQLDAAKKRESTKYVGGQRMDISDDEP